MTYTCDYCGDVFEGVEDAFEEYFCTRHCCVLWYAESAFRESDITHRFKCVEDAENSE